MQLRGLSIKAHHSTEGRDKAKQPFKKKKSKPSKTVISIHVTFDKSTNLFIFNDTLDAFNITFYFAVYSFIYFRFCQFQSPI